jgi:acyl carrier protein
VTEGDVLVAQIRALVAQVIGASRVPADAGADMPLAEGGLWLDSVELLRVIVACESTFELTFAPVEDLVGDGLKTLGTLAALIRSKKPRLTPPNS